MKSQDLAKFNLPDSPGVYFFKKGRSILYIGKATSLRDRVKSYFSKDLIETRGPHIVDMVFKADTVSFEKTDSVLEALILEANLIKKHKPYYNTKEKDDKSFNYVCITKEELPNVVIERGKNIDFNKMRIGEKKISHSYGPFTSGGQLKVALQILRRIFPFIDRSSSKADNYEFYKQLGLTPEISSKEAQDIYKRNIKNLCLFFEGRKSAVTKSLEKEMNAYAKAERFEEAAKVRNKLYALSHINDVALIKKEGGVLRKEKAGFRIEGYDVAHLSGKDMIGVMTVIEDGEVNKKEYRTFNIRGFSKANDTGALEEVLSRRLRHTEWGLPDLVVTDGGEAQMRVAKQVLDRYQLKIPVASVLKDERHKPKDILGEIKGSKRDILLANSEAHRFSLSLHKKKRTKNFLK